MQAGIVAFNKAQNEKSKYFVVKGVVIAMVFLAAFFYFALRYAGESVR